MSAESLAAQPATAEPAESARCGAIMAAALELITEVGYERMTMDAIAARARASKATIYRHWESKAAIVADAVLRRKASARPLADTGTLRGDLLAGIGSLVSVVRDEDLGLVTGMLSAAQSDPELGRLLRQCVFSEKKAVARRWADAAVARGEITPDADVDLAHEIAQSLVFQRIVVTGEPVDDAFVVHLVDNVLIPLLTRGAVSP